MLFQHPIIDLFFFFALVYTATLLGKPRIKYCTMVWGICVHLTSRALLMSGEKVLGAVFQFIPKVFGGVEVRAFKYIQVFLLQPWQNMLHGLLYWNRFGPA